MATLCWDDTAKIGYEKMDGWGARHIADRSSGGGMDACTSGGGQLPVHEGRCGLMGDD